MKLKQARAGRCPSLACFSSDAPENTTKDPVVAELQVELPRWPQDAFGISVAYASLRIVEDQVRMILRHMQEGEGYIVKSLVFDGLLYGLSLSSFNGLNT